MKFLIPLSIIVLSVFLIHGQEGREIANDPKAIALLEKVSDSYHSNSSMKVNFSLLVDLPDEEVKHKSKGHVYLKDEKYKIDTEEMTIICDNVKRYVYLKESNELQINYFEPEEDEIESPSELFDIYKEDYYSRTIGQEVAGNASMKLIELIPSDINDSPYKSIYLQVDEGKSTLVQAVIHSKDGSKYIYAITSTEPNIEFEDAEFSFDPSQHPGIYIDDMTK